MAAPDIPAAKRAGLPVDLDRLAEEGDGWLAPEDRYALKTHGICTQLQDGVFMNRIRVPGGVLPTAQARALGRLAEQHAEGWLHLTTRQNVELHWVRARDVRDVQRGLAEVGLSSRSSCGHTLRNVMCSEDAGVSLDEPFDCFPDARMVSDAIVARSVELNCTLPSRLNVAFGGSPRCREDALLNDAAFVSTVRDGLAGYEVWGGGSLGKSPSLAVHLADFVAREDVLAAAEALIELFIEHGSFDKPSQGRLKFVVQALGPDGFRAAWEQRFAEARERPHPSPVPVDLLGEGDHRALLGVLPAGGWSRGVRPQRTPGFASVTIDVPLGDTSSSEIELLADLADRYADGHLMIGRDQDLVLRNVRIADVDGIRRAVARRGLHLLGEGGTAAVRACTGSAVCALGIADAPGAGKGLLDVDGLRRNSALRVFVSGCPNSCAQHQAADIGLSGTKARIGGRTRIGFHIHLGADLATEQVGEVVGRVAAEDVPAAVEAIVGAWESVRRVGETLGITVRRVGLDAFAAHLEAVMDDRWASGPEPDGTPVEATVALVPASSAA